MSLLSKHWIVVIGAALCACEGSQAGLLGELANAISKDAPQTEPASPTSGSAGAPAVPVDPVTAPTSPDASQPDAQTPAPAPTTPAEPTVVTKPPLDDSSRGRLEDGPDITCYEFKTHASTTSVDDNPFLVGDGDLTEQFYFHAPWPTGSVATSFATISDNAQVLHHWYLFSTSEDYPEGDHITSPLPTLIGTDPVVLATWGAGGPNLIAPDDIGFQLPAQGAQLNLQWSYSNTTGHPQPDASVVQICVTPKEKRAHVAGVTWLGTEELNGNEWFGGAGMPPRQVSTFHATCRPGRDGLSANEAIQIVGYQPHMQALGTRMKTAVEHTDGSSEVLFDEPFQFGDEKPYFRRYELLPGESLTTSCTFDNTTDAGVPFGSGSDAEVCYQFVFSYPVGALSNAAPSLLGAADTCW